jgi:hypothetical protein
MRLHNFVLENDGLKLESMETDIRKQFGVLPLPAQEGLDAENNGFLPTIADEMQELHLNSHRQAARRDKILSNITANGLTRPSRNIERNE